MHPVGKWDILCYSQQILNERRPAKLQSSVTSSSDWFAWKETFFSPAGEAACRTCAVARASSRASSRVPSRLTLFFPASSDRCPRTQVFHFLPSSAKPSTSLVSNWFWASLRCSQSRSTYLPACSGRLPWGACTVCVAISAEGSSKRNWQQHPCGSWQGKPQISIQAPPRIAGLMMFLVQVLLIGLLCPADGA